jgi:uncharacterized protein (DUF1501 family)
MCDRLTRRGFLVGCSGAIAALAGPRFNNIAFADPGSTNEILLVIFLRGGMDGLSFVFPTSGADRGHLQTLRPSLVIPTSGVGAALPIAGQPFGFHPNMGPLYDIYQQGKLAVVRACGLPSVNRSHFDAMQYVELGTPGVKSTLTGWLTRHLASATNLPTQVVLPSLAVGDLQPTSLAGSTETVNMVSPDSFDLDNGPWLWRSAQRTALRRLYNADSTWNHTSGLQALDAVDVVDLNINGPYAPANGAVYDANSSFHDHLKVLAQMIKLDLGLAVATVDYGGWDTHEGQANGGTASGATGYLADLLADLCSGLGAFYTDLDGAGGGNFTSRLTVVVQSEFGREVRENSDNGTEHGYGNMLWVLSGHANGGLHGQWPGLNPAGQLFEGTDLAVITDYRRVLSEVLIRRCANPNLAAIFPGYTGYAPLGVVSGVDLPPIQTGDLGRSTFETGTTSEWSAHVG